MANSKRQRKRSALSTDEARPDGQEFGVVKRFKKQESASKLPLALQWIKSFGEDFIEYTATTAEMRGIMVCLGTFGFMFGTVGFCMGADALTSGELAWAIIGGVFFFGTTAFFVLASLWCYRMELFMPADQPTVFDRRRRKVYRAVWVAPPGFKGLFQRWSMAVRTFDWDLIDAEHQSSLGSTGPAVNRTDRLVFLVRKSSDDPTIVDRFTIGQASMLTEQTVPCIWEHIRRFMEEDGPPLPPGETLAPSPAPKNFWHAFQGPFGPRYFFWWKNWPVVMLVFHFGFPIVGPMALFWGIGNWLSYKTSTPVKWPEEVLEAIGATPVRVRHEQGGIERQGMDRDAAA